MGKFIFILLFISFYGYSQEIKVDRFSHKLKNAQTFEDSLEIYTVEAKQLILNAPEKSISISSSLLKKAQARNNHYYTAIAYMHLAEAHIDLSKYDIAIKELTLALNIAHKNKRIDLEALIKYQLGRAYHFLGNYKESIVNYKASLAIAYKRNKNPLATDILVGIAIISLETKDFDSPKDFLNEAVSLSKKEKYWEGYIKAKKTLALLESYKGNHVEALKLLKEVAVFEEKKSFNEIQKIVTLINIAAINYSLKDLKEAKKYYLQALARLKITSNKMLLAKCYYHLSLIEYSTGNREKAYNFGLKAYQLSVETNNKKTLLQSVALLSKLNEEKNNYKEALKYSKISTNYKDSLYNHGIQGDLYEARTRYKLKEFALKKDKALAILQSKKNKHILVACIISFTIILLILFYNKERLQKINNRLVISNEAKANFLTKMTHELRTPLNAIVGNTDLLLKTTSPSPKQKELLKIMQQSGESLSIMTEDIFDFTNYNENNLTLTLSPEHLKNLCEEVLSLVKVKADKKGVELISKIYLDPTKQVLVDKLKLRRVIYNLLNNAVKFTDKGSVVFCVSPEEEKLDFFAIKFSISDTGKGINEHNKQVIFTEFFQEESEYTRKYGGIGLGLSISLKIIRLMGSELKLKSKPGKGSTFYFTLFLKETSENVEDIPEPLGENDKPYKILIVEDNKINLMLTKKILSTLYKNAILLEAYNGEEGVVSCKNNSPDLILMDIQMPVMNGLEATKIIRQTHISIPILALSAASKEENLEKSIAMGINEYIEKPITLKKMNKILRKYLT